VVKGGKGCRATHSLALPDPDLDPSLDPDLAFLSYVSLTCPFALGTWGLWRFRLRGFGLRGASPLQITCFYVLQNARFYGMLSLPIDKT
jgi:hypothetical protein